MEISYECYRWHDNDGLEFIPESDDITEEDMQWLSELHITASKSVADPQVNLRQESEPDSTKNP